MNINKVDCLKQRLMQKFRKMTENLLRLNMLQVKQPGWAHSPWTVLLIYDHHFSGEGDIRMTILSDLHNDYCNTCKSYVGLGKAEEFLMFHVLR